MTASTPALALLGRAVAAAPPCADDARWPRRVATALRAAAAAWLGLALLGQLMFAFYVAGFYGRTALQGRLDEWKRVLPHGYVAGDTAMNLV